MAMNFNIDANDIIKRLTEENSNNLTRALIAEAARDSIVDALQSNSSLHLIQHLLADDESPAPQPVPAAPQPVPAQPAPAEPEPAATETVQNFSSEDLESVEHVARRYGVTNAAEDQPAGDSDVPEETTNGY